MKYANFCFNCGAKAIGKFCVKCGSRIAVSDAQPETEEHEIRARKIVGLKYHRVGMSMGKYLTVLPGDFGYDVVESSNDIPWPERNMFGGFFTGFLQSMQQMTGAAPGGETKAAAPPSEEELREAGGMMSIVRISKEEGDAFFRELTAAGILSWDGFSGITAIPPGIYDAQDQFSLSGVYEDGRIFHASGSNAYPDGYNEMMKIIGGFFRRHVDYSRYYPTEFPDEIPGYLSVKAGTDLPGYDYYAHVDITGSERKWRISVKDKKGRYAAPDTFLVDAGVMEEASGDRLPFQRFIGLLKKYDMGKLNQAGNLAKEEDSPGIADRMEISIYITYSGDRICRIGISAKDSEYGDFFRDFTKELLDCHEELKDTSIL